MNPERRRGFPLPAVRTRRDFLRAIGASVALSMGSPAPGDSPSSPAQFAPPCGDNPARQDEYGIRIVLNDLAGGAPDESLLAEVADSLRLGPLLESLDSSLKPMTVIREKEKSRVVAARSAVCGPSRFRIDALPSHPEFAVTILKDSFSELSLYRTTQGQWHLMQVALGSEARSSPKDQLKNQLFEFSIIQDEFAQGKFRDATGRIEGLKHTGLKEPITLVIAARLQALRRDHVGLALAAGELTRLGLPDGLVASARAAELLAATETGRREVEYLRSRADDFYRRSLDEGLPTLLPFFEDLWDWARRSKADLSGTRYGVLLAEVAPRRIRYQPWSAWNTGE